MRKGRITHQMYDTHTYIPQHGLTLINSKPKNNNNKRKYKKKNLQNVAP